ncbi:NupC/NupG family nucleoside CNT transporter [candidate division KSB1 bacterium]|nr:NupC/NupG family nucleoside CNT transporter [candidate division KSB1 bacterium]NIR70353.1 NupC/NupG family nucleoside CNT transporter [candidate division KSB1 bacterium]NIS24477.1 NupC/NupG family nucleoside CNT transporter [candidate division KSB1 bacterium]NIT71405.1 NupC/NupG family nucleoside CNT transporter [candidate division KSB1 bacterium]NIU23540.1 NupC/NupG family nucleoside CNT transporter [candidate division KSB1 bacterium]
MQRLISVFGCVVILAIAWLLSNNKRQIDYRIVLWGLLLQFLLAVVILKTSAGHAFFFYVNAFFAKLLGFADAGVSLLFGDLFQKTDILEQLRGADSYQIWNPERSKFMNMGIVFALYVLPTIIFFASLMSVLYHLGLMQYLVKGTSKIMAKFIGISGAETVSVTANIFVGQIEAPLMVRPYVSEMTRSELMTLMSSGFGTLTVGMLALYGDWGIDARHLLAASVMSALAALVIAKIMCPETDTPKTKSEIKITVGKDSANLLDAAANGAVMGLKLVLNIAATLLAFLALVAMIDFLLLKIGVLFGLENSTIETILGYAFAPLALVMGVEAADVLNFGYLMGAQISINEFVAYDQLVQWKSVLSTRSVVIGTYALCGFASFGSIAIQLGGIGGIAPDRRRDLAKLSWKAMIAGALASWLTASMAGILV